MSGPAAGAIAAALLKRERTGETSVVDVSLLGIALWRRVRRTIEAAANAEGV